MDGTLGKDCHLILRELVANHCCAVLGNVLCAQGAFDDDVDLCRPRVRLKSVSFMVQGFPSKINLRVVC
jgi:hypothetical protein